jgi:RHS repeat-associated protein
VRVNAPDLSDEERYAFDAGENMSRGGKPWVFDGGDRLVSAEGQRYEYDSCGNRTRAVDPSGAVMRFEYDDEGQLGRVERADGTVVEFRYDAFGRRVLKRVGDRGTRYVWQEDRILMEIDSDGRRRLFVYYPGSFVPIGWVDHDGEESRSYFLHTDHMGRPQEATDESGRLVWAPVYDAYGRVLRHAVAEVECPLRSIGQYSDPETGLYYNRYRYFDPVTACYLTPDPIGLDGGINPYRYCSNPLGWADPLGLAGERPCWQASQIPPIYDGSRALQTLSKALVEKDPFRQAELLVEGERLLAQDHGITVLEWRGDETNIHNKKQRDPGVQGDRGMVLYDQRIILVGEPGGTRRAAELQHEAGAILLADQNPPTASQLAENPSSWKNSIPRMSEGGWSTHALDKHGKERARDDE